MADLTPVTRDDLAVMIAGMRDEMRTADATRQAIEDTRSVRRNRNRLAVLIVAFMINMIWPVIMLHVMHDVAGTAWTPALSSSADILVTAYAWYRRY